MKGLFAIKSAVNLGWNGALNNATKPEKQNITKLTHIGYNELCCKQ